MLHYSATNPSALFMLNILGIPPQLLGYGKA